MSKFIVLAAAVFFSLSSHASQKIGSYTCNVFLQGPNTLKTVEIPLLDVTDSKGQFLYEQTVVPMKSEGTNFKLGFVFWLQKSRALEPWERSNPVKIGLAKLDKVSFFVAAYPENIDQLRSDAQA
ncbi:MAG: hypothetical protein EOP06_21420, partial [Proteobacteria bacterium]